MNAELELKRALIDRAKIKCAYIHNESKRLFLLKLHYSDFELEKFYKELDFEYDSGYGGQELFGTVWLEDGTWLSRGDYDGSEWWEHNSLPEIPMSLTRVIGDFFNTRLLSKEESIKIFIDNSIKASKVANSSYYNFVPENLEEMAQKLFSLDNVFVSRKPMEYYFNDEGNFEKEIFVCTDRGKLGEKEVRLNQFYESVKRYLDRGAYIYLYCYYGMNLGVVTSGTVSNEDTYWWRMAKVKHENK